LFATGKYSNDVRFLRIWIQYVSGDPCVQSPQQPLCEDMLLAADIVWLKELKANGQREAGD
jgi:hypothetical protein